MQPLPRRFFRRPADDVARELLGHLLVRRVDGHNLIVRIVETEAYLGKGDRASHAWRGVPTKRTEVLFRPGGIAYVYLVYGIHDMFNVVTGEAGNGSAVLLRSGEPITGLETMAANRGLCDDAPAGAIAGGPGRLCQALQISRELNGVDLGSGVLRICRGEPVGSDSIAVGPRVGVDYAGAASDWPLRFADRANPHVSRPRLAL